MNPIFWTDGYKLDHRRQAPAGLTEVYSNCTPRGSRVAGQEYLIAFGLQAALLKLTDAFHSDFFLQPVKQVARRYQARLERYLGPNEIGTAHIEALHALGYLPIEVCAVPEGTRVPMRCPWFTVRNTHPDFAWLTNYLETYLACETWQPATSATTAARFRQLLDTYAKLTGGDRGFVQWQGHDFSMRGMPGVAAAAASGAAHLLSFSGTDTLPAIDYVEQYYGGFGNGLYGSVPATEHSIMCAGMVEGELETFARLLDLYPTGVVSIVADTKSLWDVLTIVLPALKNRIMARAGKLVIRPDSGDPVKIVNGDPDAEDPRAQLGVLYLLDQTFGHTVTLTGHRLLDSHVGVIYGDGINDDIARRMLWHMDGNGYASTNIVLGLGSFTFQHVTRDTYGMAIKATNVIINGESHAISKSPITDSGLKHSARGYLAVTADLQLIENATEQQMAESAMKPVYRNGNLTIFQLFETIRHRVAQP